MGSAVIHGQYWGTGAQDYARYAEQVCLPLYGAVLDAAWVTQGTRLLDAGCGTGLLVLLASFRGAHVAALDAAAAQLAIVRERVPAADIREGDLEALPFPDAAFDAVTAVNSIFYAADMAAAMRELARVVRRGGRVAITTWGPMERCEYRLASQKHVAPLMPPPGPNAPTVGPTTLAAPGAMESLFTAAGLHMVEDGEVACPFMFPNMEAGWRFVLSSGNNQRAIAHSGEDAVRAAVTASLQEHMREDGSIRYENVFLWAVGERP